MKDEGKFHRLDAAALAIIVVGVTGLIVVGLLTFLKPSPDEPAQAEADALTETTEVFAASLQDRTYLEAMALAEALLQDHPYLLTAQERSRLDQINRQLRQVESRAREIASEEALREAEAQASEGVSLLARLLEERPWVAADNISSMTVRSERATTTRTLDAASVAIRVTHGGSPTTTRVEQRLRLGGDSAALLLRVTADEGDLHFVKHRLNFAWSGPRFSLEVQQSGTSWLLVELDNVPQQRTSMVIDFTSVGDRSTQVLLDLATPAWGRLELSVLSDDTGAPVPAMVRLVWAHDGRDRRPPNALDFAPELDNQGSPSGRRLINSPGPLGGQYFWCVPDPFEMAVPPGEWSVTVRRGLEHVPVEDTFRVAPGVTVTKSYRPRRWVDMRQEGWFSGDDHVHFQVRSDHDAEVLMAWVQAEGIHLANVVQMGDIYRTWFEQRGFGRAYRVVDGDYILSPGQECPRTHAVLGHTLSMNTQSMIRDTDRYYLYDWVFDAVHAQGGLTGYAHVNHGTFNVHRDMSLNIPKGKVDFAELLQFGVLGTRLYYEFLDLGFKLTATSGSDVPWGGTIGEVRMYAYLGSEDFTADAWFDAVARGHTFVTNGPMLDLRVGEDARPGDEVLIEEGHRLRIHARAWGDVDRTVPQRLEIVRHGEVIEAVESVDAKGQELRIDVELEGGNGYWLAARATGADGTQAHTTPVYVRRAPLRFWKYDAVEELLEKRLTSLEEIEQVVAEATGQFQDETMDLSLRERAQLSVQGPELLDRVADARRIYAELREQFRSEATSRATEE